MFWLVQNSESVGLGKRPRTLQRLYADVNRQCFDGRLRHARLDWAVLKAPQASGETFCDGKGFIKGSPRTISHEACHVFVGLGKEAEEHGPKFLACEARFGEVR